jgi:hypothetical protein
MKGAPRLIRQRMTGSRATSACIQPPNGVGPGAQLADEQDRLDGATSPARMYTPPRERLLDLSTPKLVNDLL